ncbi:Crp/Fnr family transcriptional regulator [Parerythrobacter jejuensis]|uniref:Helix-turn-helix domain-containing protein n=1 Tax=Parerythrobacter jejuensis TaxID=795812 RepID=A0A845AY28_9SPHN|nr:Crp/Fnr family transcriptional regulator [Parerythrobacter jejuensis]MXP30636.1 helix-turn-helix domain-containing protein [Parerythrobacter jejuensis]MXP33396.1 helix-turn-helix domain-containing protein [Parerythrobacter jejuensis]
MLHGILDSAAALPHTPFGDFVEALVPDDIEREVLLELVALGHPVSPKRGEAAYIDPCLDQLVFVADGATKLVAKTSGDREQIVAFHFAGDLVSVPTQARHAYALYALSDAHLLAFPAEKFLGSVSRSSSMAGTVVQRMILALHRCRDKSADLGRKNAEERLCSFFVMMAERIGAYRNSACDLVLPMSRRDIADALGLTIETVSRQIGRMRESGLIETKGRSGVTLLQPDTLAARAGHKCSSLGKLENLTSIKVAGR